VKKNNFIPNENNSLCHFTANNEPWSRAGLLDQCSIGPVATEIKILEYTGSVNAGFEAGGVLAPIINIKK